MKKLNALEEASKEKVEGLKIHFEVHSMEDSNELVDETLLRIRSSISFKRRVGKSVCQETRNMLRVRVIQKTMLKCYFCKLFE